MNEKLTQLLISSTDRLSSVLLDNPKVFNYVRFLLAGRQAKMKHFIKKYLEEYDCKSVADICSGTGDFAELSPKNAFYVGWDLNNNFINYAKKRYRNDKKKRFIKANILTTNLVENKKFDAVLLISTVHHFSDEELKILLPTVKGMANKVVIIADIIPDPPYALQKFFAKIDRGKFVRPAKEKIKILEKYFKVIHTQDIPTRTAVQFGIICEINK